MRCNLIVPKSFFQEGKEWERKNPYKIVSQNKMSFSLKGTKQGKQ